MPKIRRDVTKILGLDAVDEIIYFCESNLPVAKRQKLQAWAKEQGVFLQVFDGQAIAEMLTDLDTFWIAQEYLKIPSELMPRSDVNPSWYSELLKRWSNNLPLFVSRSDFVEIKTGLRHATFNPNVRPDLDLWITLIEHFLRSDAPRQLQRNASYEVIVAIYRGKGILNIGLPLFEDFYSDFDEFLGLADLQDAATLLVYAWGAYIDSAPPELLFELRRRLVSLLEQEMISAPGPGRRAGLLQIRGYLETMPLKLDGAPNLRTTAQYWSKMLDEAIHAPLFPIEDFSDFFSKIFKITGPRPELLHLTGRIDDLVAKQAGAAAAGQKAFDRANAFLEQDNILAAIQDYHRARKRWFSGDRIADALNVILILSDCYRQLGLAYASKYYALSVAYMAVHEQKPTISQLLPRALFAVVDAEDAAGNGIGLANMLLLAVGAHITFERDPFNMDVHIRLKDNLGQMQALLGFLKRGDSVIFGNVKPIFDDWPTPLSGVLEKCSNPEGFWNKGEWPDAWSQIENSLIDRPWGDVTALRTVSWKALGINWKFEFDNSYSVTPIAEQLIAEFQLTIVAIVGLGIDLAVIPTSVWLTLSVAKDAKKPKLNDAQYRKDGISFSLIVPEVEAYDIKSQETLSFIVAVLRECSVFRDGQYISTASQALVAAAEQAFNIRPYRELYKEFVSQERFFESARKNKKGFQEQMPFSQKEIEEIGPNNALGPTYDQINAKIAIVRRYQIWAPYVRHTVRNLMRDSVSRKALQNLRGRGMKDWQILSIIGNISFAVRAPVDYSDGITAAKMKASQEAIALVESEDSSLGPNILSPEMLRLQEATFVSLLLNQWELDGNTSLIENTGTEKFLIDRYRIYDDDTEHENLFDWD